MLSTIDSGSGQRRLPLAGIDEISLPKGATMIFSHPAVPKKLYIHSGANSIKWSYELNTQVTPTLGGEVHQILSTYVGPITISGQTAGLRTDIEGNPRPVLSGYVNQGGRQSYNPNDELKEIMDWFLIYMEGAGNSARGLRLRDERAILFQYPERGWDFYIQVTALDGFAYNKSVYAPEWSITAEVMSDNALNFFRGITMNSFTDQLTNQNLLAKIGLSAFARGETFNNTQGVFGQDGNSKNPFLNPDISGDFATLARKMGNNFQGLVAAWSTGDFANFGFDALLDNGALPKDIDAAYQKIFGTTYLGGAPGYSGAGSGVGSSTYTVKSGVQAPPWVEAVLNKGGWPVTKENLAWLAGWGRVEGADQARQKAGFNWMNSTQGNYPFFVSSNGAHIRIYPNFDTGVEYTVKTINNGRYPDVIGALKSGNPYEKPPLEGLQTWVLGSTRNAETKKYADLVMSANASVVTGSGAPQGVASGVRLAIVNWAYKFIDYGNKTGRPAYGRGRADVENIAPGDFAGVGSISDCSNSVALLWCWGTQKNKAFATNGTSYNYSDTHTMWSTFENKKVPLEKLVAGDIIIYGTNSANSVHVDMLLEPFRGEATIMFSHGSGVPHKTTWSNVSSGRRSIAQGFQVLPI